MRDCAQRSLGPEPQRQCQAYPNSQNNANRGRSRADRTWIRAESGPVSASGSQLQGSPLDIRNGYPGRSDCPAGRCPAGSGPGSSPHSRRNNSRPVNRSRLPADRGATARSGSEVPYGTWPETHCFCRSVGFGLWGMADPAMQGRCGPPGCDFDRTMRRADRLAGRTRPAATRAVPCSPGPAGVPSCTARPRLGFGSECRPPAGPRQLSGFQWVGPYHGPAYWVPAFGSPGCSQHKQRCHSGPLFAPRPGRRKQRCNQGRFRAACRAVPDHPNPKPPLHFEGRQAFPGWPGHGPCPQYPHTLPIARYIAVPGLPGPALGQDATSCTGLRGRHALPGPPGCRVQDRLAGQWFPAVQARGANQGRFRAACRAVPDHPNPKPHCDFEGRQDATGANPLPARPARVAPANPTPPDFAGRVPRGSIHDGPNRPA